MEHTQQLHQTSVSCHRLAWARVFRHLLSGLWLAFPCLSAGQSFNLGTPPVRNYPKQVYHGGTQTWDLAQDAAGRLFFANNEGLLVFDGQYWRRFSLPNNTIIRSVAIAPDGKIYVGGQGEFGYFQPDKQGSLRYASLLDKLPAEDRHIGDVWDIVAEQERVYFRADQQLMLWTADSMRVPFSGQPLQFMARLGDRVILQTGGGELFRSEGDGFSAWADAGLPSGATVTAVLPFHPDTVLITTMRHGIHYLSGTQSGEWPLPPAVAARTNRIYCAGMLRDGRLALGTALAGLFVLERDRRVSQHLEKGTGLLNNTVLSLLPDRQDNVWLGLDNGIGMAALGAAIRSIFPDGPLQGTGYTVERNGDKLYFGTNTGLYSIDWKSYYQPEERRQFRRVPSSEGQVWSLERMEDSLYMGHHEGGFIIRNGKAERLAGPGGVWKFLTRGKDGMLAGHYNGITLFRREGSGWRAADIRQDFRESSRILVRDGMRRIWMAHPYRGIYRLELASDNTLDTIRFYHSEDGLPADYNNLVFDVGGEPVFAGNKGLYRYEPASDRFVPHARFRDFFREDERVKYLRQDAKGNIWYAAEEEVGVLQVRENALEKEVLRVPIPELSGKLVGGFEYLLPLDEHHVLVGAEEGFLHFDPAAYARSDTQLQVLFHSVWLTATADSLLFGGFLPAEGAAAPVLSAAQNGLRFQFSATDHLRQEHIEYAHRLEGLEPAWSEWSPTPSLVYNNLPPGSYRLQLKARNSRNVESRPIVYSFIIRPPWHASPLARVSYVLLFLGSLGALMYRQHRRFRVEKAALQTSRRQLEAEHQQFAEATTAAINRLQKEKLEAEVQHRNQELATTAMHLAQKSEMLQTIRTALRKIDASAGQADIVRREIRRILSMVEQDASLEADWENFYTNFDRVHSDFLRRLGDAYPQLGPHDFKLCTYLRMNLTSKEIASLLSLSVRGVEASRYRLRKRLGLDTSVNLTEFMIRF
ncbi:MAG: hypothetical protein RLY31_1216 [Bacteroidota bacterium]|jgi:ligand-binding sensor domain-containing protein